ncbi:MAG TPA: hypothetical protein ACFYEA_01675 [Candidatus Tripitaka californicus]|uniref:hypothetical protein n=1 Tax=Candidatus Tripitaka californicus TaxID=3367616 RepID=UPI00402852CB|nr:hypothetical protein [Planctomycetota bacterium]
MWKELTPKQFLEAMEYGQKEKDKAMVDFAREWTVNLGEQVGWATLYTPFHSLAYKARKAAVEHRELTEKEIKKALGDGETLTFSATILCDALYYTRQRPSTLHQGEKVVASSYEFLPDVCENSNFFPESPAYMASCVYRFPHKDLSLEAPITLVIITPTGEERLFPFDLSGIR